MMGEMVVRVCQIGMHLTGSMMCIPKLQGKIVVLNEL